MINKIRIFSYVFSSENDFEVLINDLVVLKDVEIPGYVDAVNLMPNVCIPNTKFFNVRVNKREGKPFVQQN